MLEVWRVVNKQVQTQVQRHRKTSGQWLDCAAVVKRSGKPFRPVWEVFSWEYKSNCSFQSGQEIDH